MTTTTAVSTVTPVDTRPCVTADADQPLLPPLPPLEPSTTCEHPSSILVIDPSTGTTATTAAAPIAATAGAAHDTSYTLITPAAADAIAAAAVTTTPTKRAVVWAALLLYMLMIGGAQVLFRMQVVLYGDTTTFALSTYVLFVIMGSVTAQSAYVAYQMAYLCRSATPKPRWVTPVQGFLSGVLSLTGLALYLVMTSDGGEASVLSPLTALFIIIPLAYGVLGLGDRLNVPRTLGVVLALLSAVLFAMSTGGSLQFSGRTILLFVLAVVAWGVCTLLYQVFSLKERHEYAAGYLGFVGGVVTAALVVAFAAGFPLPDFHFSASHAIVYGGGMCRGIGSVTFFLLARAMPQEAAVVAPISSLYVMLPVVVGMGFLGEAVDAWKLGGVAASVLGVLLMGVRDWSTVLPCLYRHRRGARHAKTAILPAVVSAGTLDLATATDNGGVGVGVHARDVLVAPATTVTTAIAAARLPSSALDPPSSSSSLSSSSSSSPSPTPLTTATTTGTSTPTAAPDARSIAGDIDMCERPLMAAWVAHDACGQHTTLATTTAPTTARAPRTDRGASIIPAQSTPTAATSATMTAAASPASVQRQRVPWWRVRTSKKGSRRATVEVLKDVAPNGVAAAFDDLALERQQQHEEEEEEGMVEKEALGLCEETFGWGNDDDDDRGEGGL
ncbi:hypothetical protein PTSG_10607 [Salpingoeca rosetta]|uniref:Uncharacterized protein n=1 Tax=Salpingoeca rosetta (strain ATCC 50818 / BSB-021) TaxID=946362 RepID=F2URU8_SALR5|nr:uncharacterized protein PTSG_10607 [Salpingoeca rosetta]EGD80353.1 hypothetical protein PTSG_10607 [Salpingoeca rosetta]|eukprot:XP_004988143.1 hypothetical protein PTSG_10607 [Salpingoeca rosetta]